MKRLLVATVVFLATVPAYADSIPIDMHFSSDVLLQPFTNLNDYFQLPYSAWHISLNITTFSVDDRGVLLLNDSIVASTGIGGPGNGAMALTYDGPSLPFYFQYGNSGPFSPITKWFVTGENHLSLIVNNTGQGIYDGMSSLGPSSATLIGTVTFDVGGPIPPPGPSEVPLPGALPLFATALGALGLLGWRRKQSRKRA